MPGRHGTSTAAADRSAGCDQGSHPLDDSCRALTLADLFSEQVAATPDATAVVYPQGSLTYVQLCRRSDRLARELVAAGVGPDEIVALVLPSAIDMVVAILATIRAGGAWLAIDPSYPDARFTLMLRDSAARVLVTTADHASRADHLTRCIVGGGATEWDDDVVQEPNGCISSRRADPRHCAYVMYTSGSTGQPKGVMVEHASIMHFARWFTAKVATATAGNEPLRVAHTSSFSFDASLKSLLLLMTGHQVHLLDDDVRLDADRMVAYIRRRDISFVHGVPLYIEELINHGLCEMGGRPMIVSLGGDAVRPDLWDRLRATPGVVAHNSYGPTECTVNTTVACAFSGPRDPGERVPIGRPVPGLVTLILDDRLELVRPGVAGELYVAGPTVARGYLKRPELTAERFLPCPHPPGGRMYRTGDLVRSRPDGQLEFLGRADQQIKINGIRVELVEIETALAMHPSVAASTVVADGEAGTVRRLLGYVVPRAGQEVDPSEVSRFLATQLPRHMCPSVIVPLEQLPLTSSGKVDRRRLPQPPAPERQWPRDEREDLMCRLMGEVLELDDVGPEDDFFALGGNSLQATTFVGRIRVAFDVEFDIRALFATPTPIGLIAAAGSAPRRRLPLIAHPPSARLALSYAQQRFWFLAQISPGRDYNIPYSFRLSGDLDTAAFEDAVADVMHRHEILRTRYPEVDHEPRPEVVDVNDVGPLIRVSSCRESELEKRVSAAVGQPFDLATEIPFRVWRFLLPDSDELLLLVVHHIATDGWSAGPLLRDLGAFYRSRARAGTVQMPPLEVQYGDYALWQRELLGPEPDFHGSAVEQLRFWRERLDGVPPVLPLPLSRPRASADASARMTMRFEWPAELRHAIRELAQALDLTPFMLLQTAMCVLLSGSGAGNDIALATVVAGRVDPALSPLVGCFVNTLILRTRWTGDPRFRDLAAHVKRDDLNSLAHQDLPFDQVVRSLNPQRIRAVHPFSQVLLVLQNNRRATLELAGLTVERRPDLDIGGAEFDLAWSFSDELSGSVEFSAALTEDVVEQLADGLRLVLQTAVGDPDIAVSEAAAAVAPSDLGFGSFPGRPS